MANLYRLVVCARERGQLVAHAPARLRPSGNNRAARTLDPTSCSADVFEARGQIATTKIWVSTTGPDWLVGTRYFEVLMSGTTLLLCNRPPKGSWTYSGLFRENVHVATFGVQGAWLEPAGRQ